MTLCNFCTKAVAPYTCPRCNKGFCGLDCYRGEAHRSCSEAFYETCCREALQHEELSTESRQAVLSMLQRQKAAVEEDEDAESGEEEECLATRLAGLDLDKDTDAIWERLTPSERADFEHKAASGALTRLVPIWRPWWLSDCNSPLPCCVSDLISNTPPLTQLLRRKAPHSSVRLAVLQALLTAAAVSRRLNGEHLDRAVTGEAASSILELCPALQSSHAHASEKEAVAEFAAKLCSPALLLVLLRDLLVLLQPCSGFQASQRALAELAVILRRAAKENRKRSGTEAEVKSLFCASKKTQFWLSWTAACFGQLREAVPKVEAELCTRTAEGSAQKSLQDALERSGVRQKVEKKTLIQELS